MSEQAILALFGVLIAALFAAVGFLAKVFWSKLVSLEKGQQNTDLAAFIARFNATERDWERWREAESRETRERRHGVDKRLDAHAEHFKAIELKQQALSERVARIERNGH